MSRIKLSNEDRHWIESQWRQRKIGIKDVAERLGCCIDTAKRILVRLDLAEYTGAKFATSLLHERRKAPTWDRPCIRCGRQETRPRLQFSCTGCLELAEKERTDGAFVYF